MKIEATAREIRALLALAGLDHGEASALSEADLRARDVSARRVPHRLLDRYLWLLDVGRRPAVVAILQGACSGCHLRLPTMVESLARRAPALYACPHCRRLLYAAEHLREEDHAAETKRPRSTAMTPAPRRP